jgi:O-acetyl-ADP-ribose deacetylase (regulator of RNase III)
MPNTSRYLTRFFNGRLMVMLGDLISAKVDAIVNLEYGEGFIGLSRENKIPSSMGMQFMDELAKQKHFKVGESIVTSGYKLNAKKVIHAFGPVWNGLEIDDRSKQLKKTYEKILEWVEQLNLKSIWICNKISGCL